MKTTKQKTLVMCTILVSATLVNCGKKEATALDYSADTSSSGVIAGAVGGALSDSSSSGTHAFYKFQTPASGVATIGDLLSPLPKAHATDLCPTFRSTNSDCSASGSNMWLSYNDCTFTGNNTWNGVQEITMSSGTAVCGSFPNPGANGTLYRQFVAASGGSVAGSIALDHRGLTAYIDDASANLGNFDSQTIAAVNTNGGYGIKVSFNGSGARSNLDFGHRLQISGVLDHSVTGSVSISETAGASQRVLNGTVTVYHNLMHVVGTATLTDVVHNNVCCLPVGGTISTTYADGQNVHATGARALALIGKTESLTFTGCGTADFVGADGSTGSVTLNRCF